MIFSTVTQPSNFQLLSLKNYNNINCPYVFQLLRNIVKGGTKLIILRGNHDLELQHSDLAQFMNGIPFEFKDNHVENNVRIEHGHLNDFYNAPPPKKTHNEAPMRPLGYYVARLGVTSNYSSKSAGRVVEYCKKVDVKYWAALARFGLAKIKGAAKALFKQVFDKAMQKSFKRYKNRQYMGGDWYYRSNMNPTVKQVLNQYKTLVKRYNGKVSTSRFGALVQGACGDHKWFIQRQNEILYVLGHTHDPYLKDYKRKRKSTNAMNNKIGHITHVNSGSFVKYSGKGQFVDIHIDTRRGTPTSVSLLEFNQYTTINNGKVISTKKF